MAHFWIFDPATGWAVRALDEGLALAGCTKGRARVTQEQRGSADVRVFRCQGVEEVWVLIASCNAVVRVNGLLMNPGLRVLADRDEIVQAGRAAIFFSTEQLPRMEAFQDTGKAVVCPRCKQGIASGDLAVQCPQCRVWHHQSADLNCWTYSTRCALCDHPTALDGGYRWTPEGL